MYYNLLIKYKNVQNLSNCFGNFLHLDQLPTVISTIFSYRLTWNSYDLNSRTNKWTKKPNRYRSWCCHRLSCWKHNCCRSQCHFGWPYIGGWFHFRWCSCRFFGSWSPSRNRIGIGRVDFCRFTISRGYRSGYFRSICSSCDYWSWTCCWLLCIGERAHVKMIALIYICWIVKLTGYFRDY